MSASDRSAAAHLIERWLQSAITNDEFEDGWPWHSEDPALWDIGQELCLYYHDNKEYVLAITELTEKQVSILLRSLDFLKSNLPYQFQLYPRRKSFWAKLEESFRGQVELPLTEEQKKSWPFGNTGERRQFQRVHFD